MSQPVGQRWFHNAGGVPPFDLNEQPSGRYLSLAEREEIALLKAQDKGVREIAREIGRDPGTVSRELRRKVYCCAIKDLFSNRIVGYALGDRMTADLAVAALRAAIVRRQPGGVVIVHADRGSQFRARSFRAVLVVAGLKGSMGRVASAGDNAAMESFWSLLQKNVLNQQQWRTREQLRYAMVFWIEHTYNRRRRQRGLGKLTPVEFELAFAPSSDAQAA